MKIRHETFIGAINAILAQCGEQGIVEVAEVPAAENNDVKLACLRAGGNEAADALAYTNHVEAGGQDSMHLVSDYAELGYIWVWTDNEKIVRIYAIAQR